MDKFQSVFDDATKSEKDFDYIFGAQEDEELMDNVLGFKEDGSVNLPDYSELHQTDDAATPKDIADELGEDHDTKNKPTADSNGEFDLEDEGLNLANPNTGVADAVEKKTTVDPEDIEAASDKAADCMEKTYTEALESLLKEAEEELADPGDADVEEGCKKEACGKVKKESDDGDEDDDEGEDKEKKCCGKPDCHHKPGCCKDGEGNLVDDLEDKDDKEEKEEKDEDDDEGEEGEGNLVDDLEEEVEDLGAEDKNMGVKEEQPQAPDPENNDQEQLQSNPEDVGLGEGSLVDDLEEDDNLIDEVDSPEGKISASEEKELNTDEFDDELIDMVAGK